MDYGISRSILGLRCLRKLPCEVQSVFPQEHGCFVTDNILDLLNYMRGSYVHC